MIRVGSASTRIGGSAAAGRFLARACRAATWAGPEGSASSSAIWLSIRPLSLADTARPGGIEEGSSLSESPASP